MAECVAVGKDIFVFSPMKISRCFNHSGFKPDTM